MCACVCIYIYVYIYKIYLEKYTVEVYTLNVCYKFPSCNLENTQTYVQFQEFFGSTKKMNRFHINL